MCLVCSHSGSSGSKMVCATVQLSKREVHGFRFHVSCMRVFSCYSWSFPYLTLGLPLGWVVLPLELLVFPLEWVLPLKWIVLLLGWVDLQLEWAVLPLEWVVLGMNLFAYYELPSGKPWHLITNDFSLPHFVKNRIFNKFEN